MHGKLRSKRKVPLRLIKVQLTTGLNLTRHGMRTNQRAARLRADNEERPWIGIRWMCCNVYSRVTRHPDVKKYVGRCPRCLKGLKIRVAPGGSNCRMFVAH